MKKTKRKKRSKALFITPLLLLVLCRVWYGYTKSEFYIPVSDITDETQEAPVDKTVSSGVTGNVNGLNENQLNTLGRFVQSYAHTLSKLSPRDFSPLFTELNSPNYNQHVAAYNVLCRIRKMSHMDLAPTDISVMYNVQNIEAKGNTVKVYITEDNTQKFRHMEEASYSYNINHIFILENINGNWLIADHQHEEDFFLLTQQAWDNAGGSTNAEKAKSTADILVADAQENIDDLKISTGNPPEDITVSNTNYNRDRAVAYAKEWCNKRNYTGRWLAYDMYGGNCQNFASQCIFAGGIAMDSKGYPESQWKFYSQTLNNRQTPSGRSYSWTGVDSFYTYAIINRSNGLICQADMALEYAQKGDVIQVGAYDEWRHSLVVTDVMFNTDGSLQDIVVASNTADRWNYPLSAYIYTYPRLIHILGQN